MPTPRRPLLVLPALLTLSTLAAVAARAQPPAHVDTLQGVVVTDRYRWLERVDGADVRRWVRGEDSAARRLLATLPSREATRALVARIAAVEAYGVSLPYPSIRESGRYFLSLSPAVGPQRGMRLVVRDSATGATHTVLAPDASGAAPARVARRAFAAPDGELVAYADAVGATEWGTVRVRSVATGRDLPDSLAGFFRYSALSWSREPGRPGFYYTRFALPPGGPAAGRPPGPGAVYFHRVGDAQARDSLVFAPDGQTTTATPVATDDGRHLVIAVRRGTARESQLWVRDLADRARPPRRVAGPDGSSYVFLGNDGPVLWVATDSGAPRGRVLAIDVRDPRAARRRELIPESGDAMDTWTTGAAVGGQLVVLYRRHGAFAVRVFARDGRLRHDLAVPGSGSLWTGVVGKTTDPEALLVAQGVADPGTLYRLDVRSGRMTELLRPETPYDPSRIVTEQVFYTARDGTRVPMFVARRRDVPLDGSAPLWIYGYGAQRWTAAPWFQPAVAAWLLDGGIWAVPNTRGGAAYGEAWYQAGSRRHKQTAIDDYLAAVDWLVARRYTAAGRVVAHATSAGGVVGAAAALQRPELFGAVVLEYALLDVLRYEHLLGGNRMTEDYGTVADAGDVRAMLGYAPIQRADAGGCLPATLVTPGEVDQTAAPAHSYKLVAALQRAQRCPDRPILLRVSWGAGHTSGATLAEAADNWADQIAFARRYLRRAGPRDTAAVIPRTSRR
jgi:prolyl oligopeptidase